jgi:hypothetical protein
MIGVAHVSDAASGCIMHAAASVVSVMTQLDEQWHLMRSSAGISADPMVVSAILLSCQWRCVFELC